MKKNRISMIALLALIMGVAGTAFTFKEAPVKLTNTYYYQYGENSSTQLMDNTKWSHIASPGDAGCNSEVDLNCVIQLEEAPDGSGNPPVFSTLGFSNASDLTPVTVRWKDSE